MNQKDAFDIYFKDIKNLPLLSFEEEKKLAERIEKGDKAAKDKMIQANLRLVVSIAKRYTKLGLAFSDVVEEGNFGLMKAVDRYNFRHGYRFSTYASWWIKQAIIGAITNQGKTVRIPAYMVEEIARLHKATGRLTQNLGRPPTDHKIAKELKIKVERVKIIKSIIQNTVSLNEPIGEDDTEQLGNLVGDEKSIFPPKEVSNQIEHERLMNYLDRLPSRKAKILKYKYGLDDNEPHSFEATGRKFGITGERVRQIEASIIREFQEFRMLEEIRTKS